MQLYALRMVGGREVLYLLYVHVFMYQLQIKKIKGETKNESQG